jgi:very-short-patch-repair endonuclease
VGKIENRFLDFTEAVNFCRNLKLKNKSEWRIYKSSGKKPKNIPSNPNIVYRKEWISLSHWLGTNNKFHGNKNILEFDQAKKISQNIKLKTKKEWENYMFIEKRNDLPRRPDLYYKEWISWSDWLGLESKSDRNFLKIDEVRNILSDNNITNKKQYNEFYRKVIGMPSNPIIKYNLSSWMSLFDKDYSDDFLSYSESKIIIHKIGLSSQKQWYILCKSNLIPKRIPKTPNKFYKEWVSWNDWLGHSISTYKKLLSYIEAKEFVSELNLSSIQEYYDYLISNNINFLPLSPICFYKDEWEGSDIFLSSSSSKISYGEKKIQSYLDMIGIDYVQQKTFDKCLRIKKLMFDFFIPDLNMCIEFDGRQHFEPIPYFGGNEAFIIRKESDMIKNNFCRDNNINLIRISYEDINIVDNILSEKIKTI